MKTSLIAGIIFLSLSAHAQDVQQGQIKFASCAACHGNQGQGGVGPKLQGQKADAIVKKLTAYKNQQQVGPQSQLMWGIASGLTPVDIKNVAAYIVTLK